MKGADVGGPVTEEAHRHLIGSSHLGRPGGAVGDGEMGADYGVGAHHPVLDRGQVHRTALSPQDPVLPAQQLGEHRARLGAAGQGVGMAAIGGEGVVVGPHRLGEAGGNRLHPQREMGGALHQVLHEEVVGAFFELPKQLLGLVEPETTVDRDVEPIVVPILRCGEPRLPQGIVVEALIGRLPGAHRHLSESRI